MQIVARWVWTCEQLTFFNTRNQTLNIYILIVFFNNEILVFVHERFHFHIAHLAHGARSPSHKVADRFVSFDIDRVIMCSFDIYYRRLTIYKIGYDFRSTFSTPLKISTNEQNVKAY